MKIIRLAVAVLLIDCAGSARAEQPRACTEMGCVNGLTLSIPQDFVWQQGQYNFTMAIDGKIAHCSGALPLKSCEAGNSITCDTPGIMIMESGCALPPESQGFGDIHFDSAPRKVNIFIERDKTMLFQQSIGPKYIDVTPNGAQCEPKCRQASVPLMPYIAVK